MTEILEFQYNGHGDMVLKCDARVKMGQRDLSLMKIEESKALFPDSDDETMDLQHMLLEPTLELDLSHDLMFTKPEDAKGCLVIEDLIHPIVLSDRKTDFEMVHSDATPVRKQELKCRSQLFADATCQGYEEELFRQNKCASAFPDFLSEFFLGSHASQNMLSINCGPELQTQGRNNDSDEAEFLDLSNVFTTPCVPVSDEIILLTDDVHNYKYADDIGSASGQDTYDDSKHWIKHHEAFGLRSSTETEIYPSLLTCSLTSNNEEDQMFWTTNHLFEGLPIPFCSISDSNGSTVEECTERSIHSSQEDSRRIYASIEDKDELGSLNVEDEESAVTTNKRSLECIQGCNQETSQLKSTCNSGRLEVSYIANRSNLSCSESDDKYPSNESKLGLLFHHQCPSWSVIQKPRNLRPRRSRPWRSPVILFNGAVGNEDNLSGSGSRPTYASRHLTSDSQSDISKFLVRSSKKAKSGIKRKPHRLWTLSEVTKLIEGVSQCGVGRWTEIKKLLFSTSAARTSVDLKDKWRNLLKASATQFQNKRKAEPQRKSAMHHIPQSLLQRIRELSDVHPYTGDEKPRSLPSSVILSSVS